MSVTARLKVDGKSDPDAPGDFDILTLGPDYQDGRNAEFFAATPAINLTMSVQKSVAEQFNLGDLFTLTLDRTDDDGESGPQASRTEVVDFN